MLYSTRSLDKTQISQHNPYLHMKKILFIVTLLILALVAIILFSNQEEAEPVADITVAATIFPIYDLTRVIAGDAADVELLLPPGASEHTFEPTPSTIRQLQGASVVYAIDHGIDGWLDGIIESVDAEKVIVDKGITIRESVDPDEGETDPHYWLSIPNSKIMARTITDDLSIRYPEHAGTFESNLSQLLLDLDAADAEIRASFELIENKNIITLHDAWYYFAEEYGLTIVGTFEPSPGREPTPQYLIALMNAIEDSGSTALYSEPQLPITGLKSFADDNGLTIAELDPVGGVEGRDSYIELMKYNAEIIAQNQ